jgi:beta-glucosidase
MMEKLKAVHSFPETFLWGTATSSYQVEGGISNNDWAQWEQEPGRIHQGQRAGLACDWWNGRWRQDLEWAAEAGQNSHRLSLEWSRLEPEAGTWDEEAVNTYREILTGIRSLGMTPMVTLHHFTNPAWIMAKGDWRDEGAVEHFERYTKRVLDSFGDLVALWVTINEPNVYAYSAYADGVFPPGEKDLRSALRVMINLIKAHARAYRLIHQHQPHAQVGIAHHYRSFKPAPAFHPLNRLVASLRSSIFNSTIPEACATGVVRLPWRRLEVMEAENTQDFFGLNYYTREHTVFDPRAVNQLFGRSYLPPSVELSPTKFIANEPEGFWEALRWAHGFGLPIYVTENGVEDDADSMRPRYIVQHLRKLWKAVNFNWQVKGYFYWSLVDNFEWERGWSQRFGLWRLDPETQERVKRPSADLYAAVCRQRALTSDLVAQYTPELMPLIFPPSRPGELPDL